MSANIKVIDGVIKLTEFDTSSLDSPSSNESYLYLSDDGSALSRVTSVTPSGTNYLLESPATSGIVLQDASGVQWLIGVSTSGTFTAATGAW